MSETSPTSVQLTTQMQKRLDEIARLDGALQARFEARMRVDQTISRQLVSFQANKELASYRWYKYKEAFSAPLVEHFLAQYGVATGTLLDPFAGSGTALFAASNMGLDAYGIELLPIGAEIIKVRLLLESGLGEKDRIRLRQWAVDHPWEGAVNRVALPTLRITAGAYPRETAEAIEKYTAALLDENGYVQAVLRFALLCVLESTSFTRKDGQYLRWDHRSGRRVGSRPFDKGPILAFEDAISAKILQILADTGPFAANLSASTEFLQLQMFAQSSKRGSIRNDTGSCLDILPRALAPTR